jgi:HEAT repeat protein
VKQVPSSVIEEDLTNHALRLTSEERPFMRRQQSKGKQGGSGAGRGAQSLEERAEELLHRLESDGQNLLNAAEELDRLQGALERAGALGGVAARVAELCDGWAEESLRGDRARAWLTLVGAFDLKEHSVQTAELAENPGLPAPLRRHACQVLPRLGGEVAGRALQTVLRSNTDPQVRAAAAEALADLGDRSARPVMETLLEAEIPRDVWTAVSAALDRLR